MAGLCAFVFIISTSIVAYEILLMRLLSIIQWHHFASMIISLALLGYSASGTFIAIYQKRILAGFTRFITLNAVICTLSMVGGFIIVQVISFNPLEILWEKKQILRLLGTFSVLFFPFFLASNCICSTFLRFKGKIHRLYLFDLLGAGAGALGMTILLFFFHPVTCLKILGVSGFLAAVIALLTFRTKRSVAISLLILLMAFLSFNVWPSRWISPNLSEYKHLSLALRVPNSTIETERFSPLGWLVSVKSPTIPFRHAPGLSLNCDLEPPEQIGIFIDGEAFTPITRYSGERLTLSYLDYLCSALPYHLKANPHVLILGAGGGMDILMALFYGAKTIDAVEANPQMIDLVKRHYADFSGNILDKKEVHIHIDDGRGYIAKSNKSFDIIHVSLLDSFNTSSAGMGGLSVSYLYTTEALQTYYKHLAPDGILSITRWLKVPPRDSLKLFGTAIQALQKSGTDRPGKHLALIRSWKTSTLLIKKKAFSPNEISIIKKFCEDRSFDSVFFPGITREEVNKYNILETPQFYLGAMALLGGDKNDFSNRYKFRISPATDDRPYFFHFFKWRTLRELFASKDRGGLSLLEWGYPILILTFIESLLISLVFVVVPLFLGRSRKRIQAHQQLRFGCYFFFLGTAFLFIEMTFIQKFVLFLHHPVYAVSATLCAFLTFAGIGSGLSNRFFSSFGYHIQGTIIRIGVAVVGIIVISICYILLLPAFFQHWITSPIILRFVLSILIIAPLAFFMGMPFPLGLRITSLVHPDFIPWAWGINGCASVISAILAHILSIHLGFNMVILFALLLYFLAVVLLRQSPITQVNT